MALYDQLPVYKTTYDLLLSLYQFVKNMDRDYKFTLGEKIKNEVTYLVQLIYQANSKQDKRATLMEAKEKIEAVRLLLRIIQDLKQISLSQYVVMSEKIESISKQINAWSASQANRDIFSSVEDQA